MQKWIEETNLDRFRSGQVNPSGILSRGPKFRSGLSYGLSRIHVEQVYGRSSLTDDGYEYVLTSVRLCTRGLAWWQVLKGLRDGSVPIASYSSLFCKISFQAIRKWRMAYYRVMRQSSSDQSSDPIFVYLTRIVQLVVTCVIHAQIRNTRTKCTAVTCVYVYGWLGGWLGELSFICILVRVHSSS